MIETTIDKTDPRTEKELAIPADVISVVERADRLLRDQLRSARDLNLEVSWCLFVERPSAGWSVTLHVSTPNYGDGQSLRVDDLRDPLKAKNLIWEVLDGFAQTYSDKVGEQLRQIRADLKQLLTTGAS